MLVVYQLSESERWDSVVRSFQEYDVFWLSGYVKAFQIHGDGIPLLFYYEDNAVRGINVVMKRDVAQEKHFINIIPEGQYFDFSTPYGYGGWIIEGQNSDGLFSAYEEWCTNNGIVSEFVRFHPVIGNHIDSLKAYEVVPLGNTVALDLSSPEAIWANITSKNRNMIRKAQKNGVAIYSGRCPEIYKTFMEIYNATMDKDDAEEYYYFGSEFYQSVLLDLPQNAQVFYAVYEGKIIAASIMLAANGKMSYHLSGSIREFSNLAPTNLLLYEAALWGYVNGCRSLYLGGGVGSKEDGLYRFKKSFYRLDDVKRFYIGKKVLNHEKYEQLLEIRGKNDSSFFPKYRA